MLTKVAQKRTQAAEIIGTRKLVRAPETPIRQGKAEPAISSAFRPSSRVPYPGQAALAARICRAANRAKPARKPTKTDFVEHHHLRLRGESQTPIDDSKHVSPRHRGVVTAGRPVRPGAVQAREETVKPYQALAGFQELGADGGVPRRYTLPVEIAWFFSHGTEAFVGGSVGDGNPPARVGWNPTGPAGQGSAKRALEVADRGHNL
jgi:hypothetical protein